MVVLLARRWWVLYAIANRSGCRVNRSLDRFAQLLGQARAFDLILQLFQVVQKSLALLLQCLLGQVSIVVDAAEQ